MIALRSFLLAIAALPTVAAAQSASTEPSLSDMLKPGTPDALAAAFDEVCFANRSDIGLQQAAANGSARGFRPLGKPTPKKASFMAFPIMASMEQLGKSVFGCSTTSGVADDLTPSLLVEAIKTSSPGLKDVPFQIDKDSARASIVEGNRRFEVQVQLSGGQLSPIATLAVMSLSVPSR